MKKTIKQAPAKVHDPDGSLRKAAIEISQLVSGDNDYAGGIRYAVKRTLAELRREALKAEAAK